MTESEYDVLSRKYPGLTLEEVQGKTEEEIKYLFEHKRFQRWLDRTVHNHKRLRESSVRVEPHLDKIIELLECVDTPRQQKRLSVFKKIKILFCTKVKEISK